MARTERIFYILEQVRLCLERKDYIRCGHPSLLSSSLFFMPQAAVHHVLATSGWSRLGLCSKSITTSCPATHMQGQGCMQWSQTPLQRAAAT